MRVYISIILLINLLFISHLNAQTFVFGQLNQITWVAKSVIMLGIFWTIWATFYSKHQVTLIVGGYICKAERRRQRLFGRTVECAQGQCSKANFG